MNLHYVKKTDLTDCELMICRDYFELRKHPTNPIAFSKHEAGAHQYPYLYG